MPEHGHQSDHERPAQANLGSLVTTPCVEHVGYHNDQGYGRVCHGRRHLLAHRVAWAEVHGPIPDGMCVLHRCDNPPCVRVDHLFLGTRRQNSLDREMKGRGDRTGVTKHSIETVEAVKRAAGTQREIAARYGMTQPTVSRIRSGARRANK